MRIHLVVVRHGEADHNVTIETGQGPSIRYTDDGTMDSPLTSKGRDQVKLVGARIARDGDKFDLAVSSDLVRAVDTGLAITDHQPGLELLQWRSVRERRLGVFESQEAAKLKFKPLIALMQVENFIKERDLLTWKLPGGGESVVDLRERLTKQFYPKMISEAKKTKSDNGEVTVLMVSHGLTIFEQHLIFGDIARNKENFEINDGDGNVKFSDNTAVTRYVIEVEKETDKILDVKCSLYACNQHLK